MSDRKEPAPSPLDGVLSLYQGPLNHLSAVRAGGCPMHPSCSVYARQALAQHGPIVGGMMTTDRLLRCGRDELRLAPRVWVDGQWKYHDPLSANDFWMDDAEAATAGSKRFSHPPEAIGLKP